MFNFVFLYFHSLCILCIMFDDKELIVFKYEIKFFSVNPYPDGTESD